MDLSPSWQVKVRENRKHGLEKDMALVEKGMALGKRAWRWEKGAWRGAMLKGAGGNNTLTHFTPRSNLVTYTFVWKKVKIIYF